MSNNPSQPLAAAILRLLRPLVRILLRNGVSYGVFADLARWVYVDTAARVCEVPGRKTTISRISVITGLTRKEVKRLHLSASPDDRAAIDRYNRAARVISGWCRDDRFADGRGEPCPLPLAGGDVPTFEGLVRSYSGDMPVRAVLDELTRVGAVSLEADGRVRLITRGYVPEGDEAGKLAILGGDVADLIKTIDHNISGPAGERFIQRKVAYDNVPVEAALRFRKLCAVKGQDLLEEFDRWLAAHDRDSNPAASGSERRRLGVGLYYFEEEFNESSRENTGTEKRSS